MTKVVNELQEKYRKFLTAPSIEPCVFCADIHVEGQPTECARRNAEALTAEYCETGQGG